ncbi:transglutaminase domain-containing protein [Candidatus Woesearchaeota archaeon]|nr:transglutaminase domain-containing protein [Candidatus Woesearchaeota archaeon]
MAIHTPATLASSPENLYQLDSLQLQLTVNASFQLTSENPSAQVKEAQVELLLFPVEDYRQKIVQLETDGTTAENKITFLFSNPALGVQNYGYQAIIQTNSQNLQVTKKIPYPLQNIANVEKYTLPTEKIDSTNPAIISKARELSQGKDDLFEVVFSLANWVSENIKYDLNDLTTNSAQKASWVLENKQGVCDEMTSLFVAMARSLGIPAKFVSGISYTENPEVLAALGKHWAGHGWAEVYFPSVGWVSFDIAFNEFGYIDVTHIKLREGFDPDEPASKFEWLAENVQLVSSPLNLDVKIKQKGRLIPEELQLEMEILSSSTAFGSYNLVKGIVKNPTNHYSAVSLDMAAPPELEITTPHKKTLLLSPQEVQEAFWIVKLSSKLDSSYNYQLPLIIYTEKNLSVKEELLTQVNGPSFTLPLAVFIQ